ncbi:MAG: RHS repeat-associated core domain-containing protein, partial [Actinomycetota bacterium]
AGAEATSAGPVHSLQVLADGSARAWGFGATGALGEGTTDSHPTPVAVDGLAAPGTALATYAYRGDGLRTSKTVADQTKPFSWDESGPVPLVLSDGELRFVYGPGGRPLYQLDAANVPTYLHQDQLGSTRQLTSATGEVVATFTYGPYGELATSTGTATTPLRFAGEYTDAETGFVYLRARYYDPATGQFVSRDPLVALTGEPYLYAAGNPINAIDPLGLAPWDGLRRTWDATGGRAISRAAGLANNATEFVVRNRDTIASVAAVAACVGTVGTGCFVATALAVGVRNEKRFRDHGVSRDTVGSFIVDGVLSFGTLGLVRIPSQLATARLADPLARHAVPVVSGPIPRFAVESGKAGLLGGLSLLSRWTLDGRLDGLGC